MSDTETNTGREWVREVAQWHGIDVDDVLMLSRQNDPDWMGTPTDHKKAEWFRELWEHAVADRTDREIHTRGVHYATVMRDEDIVPPTNCTWEAYQNTDACYGYLSSAATAARVLGYVPLDGITDEKNNQRRLTRYGEHQLDPDPREIDLPGIVGAPYTPRVEDTAGVRYDDAEEIIEDIAKQVARELANQIYTDIEREQPFHVEVWSEKTLPSEVKSTADNDGAAAVVEGEGDLSYTVAKDFANRVNGAGKPGVILYLSDFDPAGSNMAKAMGSKICWLNRTGRLEQRVIIKKLAITAEQVEEYDFPRKPIDTNDVPENYLTRVDEWQAEHDGGAVELNVLETDISLFRRIVSDGISDLRDRDLKTKNQAKKQEWQAAAETAVREILEGQQDELDEQLAQAAAWCEEFNAVLSDAREHLETLRDLKNDARYAKADCCASQVRFDLDLPRFDPPSGEAPAPDDPLFDTARPRLENTRRAKGLDGYDA